MTRVIFVMLRALRGQAIPLTFYVKLMRIRIDSRQTRSRGDCPDGSPTVLLTGGSGVVGAALLDRLRGRPVICLAHRNAPGVDGVDGVEVIRGDVRRPRLGLDQRAFTSLAARVDAVVHAAAVTDFSRADGSLEATNIDGARHVAEFAAAANARLYHLSTAFIDSIERSDRNGLASAALRYAASKRARRSPRKACWSRPDSPRASRGSTSCARRCGPGARQAASAWRA
jgi:Male sterility protein